jgi:hypothetical protein
MLVELLLEMAELARQPHQLQVLVVRLQQIMGGYQT